MNIDREKCIRFLFDTTVPMTVRSLMATKLRKLDKEVKTFEHLNFKPHPFNGVIFEHAEEAHLNFTNGFGVNVVRGTKEGYKYYVQRMTRNGGEFMGNHLYLQNYDMACNTEAEVSIIMRKLQKKRHSVTAKIMVMSAINFLQTYKTKGK